MLPQYSGFMQIVFVIFMLLIGPILMLIPTILIGSVYITLAKRYKKRKVDRVKVANMLFWSYMVSSFVFDLLFFIVMKITTIRSSTALWQLLIIMIALESAGVHWYYMMTSKRKR